MAVVPALSASCSIATMLGSQADAAAAPAAPRVAAGADAAGAAIAVDEATAPNTGAEDDAKTIATKMASGNRHSQRNSRTCCQVRLQSQSRATSHVLSENQAEAWPPSLLVALACGVDSDPHTQEAKLPSTVPSARCLPPSCTSALRADLAIPLGGTSRASSRPDPSLSSGWGVRSTTAPKGSSKLDPIAVSTTSRTRTCSCTWTPRKPSSRRLWYSAARNGTTDGSHASMAFANCGPLANVFASCARNRRTPSSTSLGLKWMNGSTSITRLRNSLCMKKFG
mmetsp:Transcript_2298/g.4325  ORF Transcript_2298/g.4325 Transcript_2298/m.4325 type:complete len:282 (-) Transcript_2298:2188-3033(-)